MSDAKRKLEHIEISLREDVVYTGECRELYSEIVLIHQALPGISLNNVDISTRFLGYELNAPIVIEAMTGGHPSLKPINEKLALLAREYKLAIGVGSQRPILKYKFNQEVIDSYRVVREIASDTPVIGNLGITQLHETSIDEIKKLVDVINADALAIHLNPAQEVIQPEGDIDFSEVLLSKIAVLTRELGVPIIIKEVGNGLSMEVVSKFKAIGVKFFDVAGACGTNWIMIEALRNPEDSITRALGVNLLSVKWGIPTPLSLIETRHVAPEATVIASGGVWSGINACKMIALGGDLVGLARPLLKALIEKGYEGMKKYMELYIKELKTTMFLTGATSIKELRKKPIVLGPTIRNYLEQRGINVNNYLSNTWIRE